MKGSEVTPTLNELERRFPTEGAARAFLESERWPDGPVCPHCGNRDPVYSVKPNPAARIREGLFKCGACRFTFTVTVGTVMEDSHVPLKKWLAAFFLYSETNGAVKPSEMKRRLGLGSYRTAKYLHDRIELACDGELENVSKRAMQPQQVFVGLGRQQLGEM